MKYKKAHMIFILIVVLTVCWWLLSLVLNSDYIISFTSKQINKQLEQTTNITINFQALKFGAFPPRIEVYGLEVIGKEEPKPDIGKKSNNKKQSPNTHQSKTESLSSNNPQPSSEEQVSQKVLTKVSKLKVWPSFTAFLFGSLKANVELADLNLAWPLPIDIDKLIKSSDTSGTEDYSKDSDPLESIPVDKVIIRNSTFLVDITDDGSRYRVRSFNSNINAKISSLEKIKVALDIEKFSFMYDDMRVIEDAGIKTTVYWDHNRVRTSNFELKEPKFYAKGIFLGSIKNGDHTVEFIEGKKAKFSFEDRIKRMKSSISSGIEQAVEELKKITSKKYKDELDSDTDSLFRNKFRSKGKSKKQTDEYFSLNIKLSVESDFETVGRILDLENSRGYFKSDEVSIKVNIPFSDEETELQVVAPVTYTDSYLMGFHLMDGAGTLIADTSSLRLKDINVSYLNKPQAIVNGSIGFEGQGDIYFETSIIGMEFVRLMKVLDTTFTDVINFNIQNTVAPLIISGTTTPLNLSIKTLAEATSLDFLVLDKTSSKYPKPDCSVNLDLKVDDKEVGFNQTQIKCYVIDNKKDPNSNSNSSSDKDSDTSTKVKSKSKPSTIVLSGGINFNTGVDLVLDSLDFNLELAKSYLDMPTRGNSSVFISVNGNETVKTKIFVKGTGSINNVDLDDFDIKLEIADDIRIMDSDIEFISKNRKIVNEFYSGEKKQKDNGRINIKNIIINSSNPEKSKINLSANNIDQTIISSVITNFVSDAPDIKFDIDKVDLDYTGDVSKFATGKGNVFVRLKTGLIDKDTLFDKLSIKLQLNEKELSLENLSYEHRGLGVKLTGTIEKQKNLYYDLEKYEHVSYIKDLANVLSSVGINPKSNINLKLSSYNKESFKGKAMDLQSIPVITKSLMDLGIDSKLELLADLNGNFLNPQINYHLDISKLMIMSNLSSSFRVEGKYLNHKWTNNIYSDGNEVVGYYNVDLNHKNLPYELNVNMKEFDIRFLLGSPFATDFRNYAFFSASLSQSGSFPLNIDFMDLSINDLNIKYNIQVDNDYRPVFVSMVSEPFKMKYSSGNWNIISAPNISLEGEGINVAFKIKASSKEVGCSLLGKFNLPTLKEFTDIDLDISSGTIAVVGKATYTNSLLSYDVKVYSEDMINIGGLKPPIKDLDFLIHLKDGFLNVSKLSLKKGTGTLEASGGIRLKSATLNPEDLKDEESSAIVLKLKNLDMMYFVPVIKNIDTSVSGRLKLSGSDFPFNLSGFISLDKTSSISNADIRDDLVNAIRESSYSVSSEVKDAPMVNLDLKVVNKDPVHISNRNMNLDLLVDLKVGGNDINPSLVGTVQVDKGKIIYRRKFNVTNGIVSFDEYSNLDPKLDITATSSIDAYQVGLLVSGRGSDPVVDFTIDPATYYDGSVISKMDILNLVMGGTLNRNKSTSAVDSEVSTEQTMSAEAVSVIAGQLEKPIEYMLRYSGQDFVKQIYVDTYLNNAGIPTPRLNFPINVGEDLGLLFKISNSDWRVSVDYSIEDSILITGSYDRQNDNEGILTNVYNPVDTSLDVKFYFAFP